jgi:hypothetical protein
MVICDQQWMALLSLVQEARRGSRWPGGESSVGAAEASTANLILLLPPEVSPSLPQAAGRCAAPAIGAPVTGKGRHCNMSSPWDKG